MEVQVRRRKGSAIAEFGPALFLFLIVIFFPMLDLLGLLAAYCAGWYCNFAVCREAAVRKKSEEGQVLTEVNQNLFTTGIVQFIGLSSHTDNDATSAPAAGIAHHIDYELPGATAGRQPNVTCTTYLNAQPFISIPWWAAVPGMNAPMPFTIVSQRPREVTQ